MGAVWVGAVTVAIAVGLPIALWWLSRRLKPERQRAGRPGFGHVDEWLHQHYRLAALERWQVEYAIFGDMRTLKDPQLREAARSVANELLNGRLKVPWVFRLNGWIIMGLGLMVTTLGIVVQFTTHRRGVLSVFYLVEGPAGLLFGAFTLFWTAKQVRRKLLRFAPDLAGERSSPPVIATAVRPGRRRRTRR
jgi:hypothetical protein